MLHQFRQTRISTPAHRITLVVLNWCLLLSLWRAPVPWIHSHDSLDRQTASTTFWAEHLLRFHTDSATAGNRGWHLHFVMPWELADKHDDDEHPRGEPESLRIESLPVVASSSAIVRSDSGFGRVMVELPPSVPSSITLAPALYRPAGVQILLIYSDRISWRGLGCIARC